MLVGPRVAFVHVPKCAGEFVSAWMASAGLGETRNESPWKHAALSDVPALDGLRVVSTWRNPWAWHRSWYHYTAGVGGEPPLGFHRVLAEVVGDDFEGVCAAALRPALAVRRSFRTAWPNAGGPSLPLVEVTERLGIGLYSYFLLRSVVRDPLSLLSATRDDIRMRLAETTGVDAIVASERVSTGLPRALRLLGVDVSDEAEAALLSAEPVNVAAAFGPRSYRGRTGSAFPPDLDRLVREREWLPIEVLGYAGPDAPPARSAWLRPGTLAGG